MAVETTSPNFFLAEFERFEKAQARAGPTWLTPIRKAAIARFAELGFPTSRDEDWRFTNPAPIAEGEFRLAPAGSEVAPDITPFVLQAPDAPRLVFLNGRYSPALSSPGGGKGRVRVENLAVTLRTYPNEAAPYLDRQLRHQEDPFAALNTAFLDDGAFVHVPKGTVVDAVIQLLFVSVGSDEPLQAHPRVLIVAEPDSQVCILESYAGVSRNRGPGSDSYFNNPVTEIVAGERAVIRYCKLQLESTEAYHVSLLHIHQSRGSNVASHSISIGGALVRNNLHAVLDGEGAECGLDGLFIADGRQHVDNHLRVDHARPHCDSREFYKGILAGKARGVFTGRIVVHKDAQKTDAKQTNMNLLLSEEAQIDTKPQLEIRADDVKCTHGATIGQLDDDAVFYLRSRGLDEPGARRLLIHAFAHECIERIENPMLREYLEFHLPQWLPVGQASSRSLAREGP